MFTPAATAARTASEPEWWKVPSPRFCTRWESSVKGALADPLRALATHLRDAGDLALALGVE